MTGGLVVLALLAAFFILRPEIWTRAFLTRVDPRPAGLFRIAFGLVVVWTLACFAPNVRLFFSDEGLLLPAMAREVTRAPLRQLWDPIHGFEHWWSPLEALMGSSSILQLWSAPPLVLVVYGLALLSAVLMTAGRWTTVTTAATWALAEQLYRYDAMFANGGDLVMRAFLFLALFCRWGEAYSLDAWRRRRRELLGGAAQVPPLRWIPAWPLRLMMIQLALIYFLNGWHKTGPGWRDGTALYYALNLDHFYRIPAQSVVTWLQYVGVLPVLTWLTRAWELCFPLALLGVALRGYEADRRASRWPPAEAPRRIASWLVLGAAAVAAAASTREPLTGLAAAMALVGLVLLYPVARARVPGPFRVLLEWVLGKRVWLTFGVALHLGIDLGMNIGTFPQVMMAVYLAWLTGPDVDALLAIPPPRRARRHGPPSSRRGERAAGGAPAAARACAAARLRRRCGRWSPGPLQVSAGESHRAALRGPEAALALAPLFPALWWLRPLGARSPPCGRRPVASPFGGWDSGRRPDLGVPDELRYDLIDHEASPASRRLDRRACRATSSTAWSFPSDCLRSRSMPESQYPSPTRAAAREARRRGQRASKRRLRQGARSRPGLREGAARLRPGP